MKFISKEDFSKVKVALTAAYREREKKEFPDQWQVATMEQIRRLRPDSTKTAYFELFQRVVWRLTPVTCALTVGLVIVITQIDFFSVYELTKIFVSDPSDFILLALYNG
jgi:hypothetical protein